MSKFLSAYEANPTDINAFKVMRYADKHPMALCLCSATELRIFNLAKAQIRGV